MQFPAQFHKNSKLESLLTFCCTCNQQYIEKLKLNKLTSIMCLKQRRVKGCTAVITFDFPVVPFQNMPSKSNTRYILRLISQFPRTLYLPVFKAKTFYAAHPCSKRIYLRAQMPFLWAMLRPSLHFCCKLSYKTFYFNTPNANISLIIFPHSHTAITINRTSY
jgi:hypothetical protein